MLHSSTCMSIFFSVYLIISNLDIVYSSDVNDSSSVSDIVTMILWGKQRDIGKLYDGYIASPLNKYGFDSHFLQNEWRTIVQSCLGNTANLQDHLKDWHFLCISLDHNCQETVTLLPTIWKLEIPNFDTGFTSLRKH